MIRIGYDPQSDSLSLFVTAGEVVQSREVAPGVIINLDRAGQPVSVDVLVVSRRLGEAGIQSIEIDLGRR
ncbi:MAG TPA: DUF2283 domain-containing protein [bacterium]